MVKGRRASVCSFLLALLIPSAAWPIFNGHDSSPYEPDHVWRKSPLSYILRGKEGQEDKSLKERVLAESSPHRHAAALLDGSDQFPGALPLRRSDGA